MQLLDRTLPTPQENLACDEALLELCEAGLSPGILRFWEPRQYFVVLGYSNKAATETDAQTCREQGVPILRRSTGGGTVLQGPGCLNYTLVLRIGSTPELSSVTSTNCFVMKQHRVALQSLVAEKIEIEGYTDLAIGGRKFSGNAQRRGRKFALFHGCFLLDFDLAKIEQHLAMPSRQPPYRQKRRHIEFVRNLELPPDLVKGALTKNWMASEPLVSFPEARIKCSVRGKYSCDEWNFKF